MEEANHGSADDSRGGAGTSAGGFRSGVGSVDSAERSRAPEDVLWFRKVGFLDSIDTLSRSWVWVQVGVTAGAAGGVRPRTHEPLFAKFTMCRASS